MKLFLVYLFIVVLIKHFCVSQFHQDDYDIEQDRIETYEVNKTATPTLILKVFKYNDTLKMKAINLTVILKTEIRKNILLTFAVFKNVQKIYRKFPFPDVSLDVCEEYEKLGERNPFGIQKAISQSNFKGCPTKPGLYYLDTWVIEQEKFPPHLPGGEYKLTIHAVIDDNIFIVDAAWFGSIVKKAKKKKH